jgi:hypothetical protein
LREKSPLLEPKVRGRNGVTSKWRALRLINQPRVISSVGIFPALRRAALLQKTRLNAAPLLGWGKKIDESAFSPRFW